ncbi:DUF4241 domain-containing protein [Fusobacteria bacterium ZRK30]|nr:DUF4241 domain-containing protein [Fusobacteria bacterium ZRK30]
MMRLEVATTKYTLKYMFGDIKSMKQALKDYVELIRNGKAFEDSYCVAHFELQGEPISIDYFKEHKDLIEYLEESSPFFFMNSDRENIQASTTGEALFFLCAAMYPELENDMKEACEAMVTFSRRLNDSSYMWLTYESPFGVEPLQITATKYPRYGYLLASFLIPYWDDEHMPDALFSLGNWAHKLGITEDTLKAYCYCDNLRARQNMLGYDTWEGGVDQAIEGSKFDLLTHFREKPEEYEKFKNILVKRYREMPHIHYSNDEYDMNPTRNLVIEILYLEHPYNTWKDDHDMDHWLTNRFIDNQASEAIIELEEYIEKKLERPITSLEEVHSQFAEQETFKAILAQAYKNQIKNKKIMYCGINITSKTEELLLLNLHNNGLSSEITKESLSHIKKFKNHNSCTNFDSSILKYCKNIKELDLTGAYFLENFSFLKKLKKLEILNLTRCNISSVRLLFKLKRLKIVCISENNKISNKWIQILKENIPEVFYLPPKTKILSGGSLLQIQNDTFDKTNSKLYDANGYLITESVSYYGSNSENKIIHKRVNLDDDLVKQLNIKESGYYSNGKIKYRGNFINSEPEGVWKWYYENGVINQKSRYENGVTRGTIKKFDETGRMLALDLLNPYKNLGDMDGLIEISSISFSSPELIALDPLIHLAGEDEDVLFGSRFEDSIDEKLFYKVFVKKEGRNIERIKIISEKELSPQSLIYQLACRESDEISSLDRDLGEYLGIPIDTGTFCIGDQESMERAQTFFEARSNEDLEFEIYDDYFYSILEKEEIIIWNIPDTKNKILICNTGCGDGNFPVYFGYNTKGNIKSIDILFMNIYQ